MGNGLVTIQGALFGNITSINQNSPNAFLTIAANSNGNYFGPLNINNGTYQVSASAPTALNLNNTVNMTASGVFDLNSVNNTTVSGFNAPTGAGIVNNGGSPATLIFLGAGNYTYNGSIGQPTDINTALTFKMAAGTQTLGGDVTTNASGGLQVFTGTVNLTGAIDPAVTAGVTVTGGAQFTERGCHHIEFARHDRRRGYVQRGARPCPGDPGRSQPDRDWLSDPRGRHLDFCQRGVQFDERLYRSHHGQRWRYADPELRWHAQWHEQYRRPGSHSFS